MELTELLDEINSAYRGTDDDAPVTGTGDHDYWMLVINRKIRQWARDSKQNWQSLWSEDAPIEAGTVATNGTTTLTGTSTHFTDYRVGDQILVSGQTVRTIATITDDTTLTVTVAFSGTNSGKTFYHTSIITAGVQSYSLNRRFINPSDDVHVLTTDDQDIKYTMVKPQTRGTEFRSVYTSSDRPKVLTFYDEIVSGAQIVGGSLQVPGYYMPSPMSDDTDLVPVDDPDWLVYAVAGELAANDLIYESKSADLILRSNQLYSAMAQNNRRLTSGNPTKSRYNVFRIPGSNR